MFEIKSDDKELTNAVYKYLQDVVLAGYAVIKKDGDKYLNYCCNNVELDKDGITFENCYSSGYITDSATIPTHPNSKGHEMIYNQILRDLSI